MARYVYAIDRKARWEAYLVLLVSVTGTEAVEIGPEEEEVRQVERCGGYKYYGCDKEPLRHLPALYRG